LFPVTLIQINDPRPFFRRAPASATGDQPLYAAV
jgi:hypothetical protein